MIVHIKIRKIKKYGNDSCLNQTPWVSNLLIIINYTYEKIKTIRRIYRILKHGHGKQEIWHKTCIWNLRHPRTSYSEKLCWLPSRYMSILYHLMEEPTEFFYLVYTFSTHRFQMFCITGPILYSKWVLFSSIDICKTYPWECSNNALSILLYEATSWWWRR